MEEMEDNIKYIYNLLLLLYIFSSIFPSSVFHFFQQQFSIKSGFSD